MDSLICVDKIGQSHAFSQFSRHAIRSGLVKPVKSHGVRRSRDARVSISLAVRSADCVLKFCLRRIFEVVLAMGVRPRCKCHFRTTWAGDRPLDLATLASPMTLVAMKFWVRIRFDLSWTTLSQETLKNEKSATLFSCTFQSGRLSACGSL